MDGRDLLPEEDLDADIPEDELFARAVLASKIMAADAHNAEQAALLADEEEKAMASQECPSQVISYGIYSAMVPFPAVSFSPVLCCCQVSGLGQEPAKGGGRSPLQFVRPKASQELA